MQSVGNYTYWTMEFYDRTNGLRGGGGLGVLAADTRRVAERLGTPFTVITPFYPSESYQAFVDGHSTDEFRTVNPTDYGFNLIDTVNIKTRSGLTRLDVVEKILGSTRLVCITEPNFRELYAGLSSSDHRLYQEVALGFGGYQALRLLKIKPSVIHLNEVATFFAALAHLDHLTSGGMDFYEALVLVRKHALYTNHTLIQAAEASFSHSQFENFVYPNLKSPEVLRWLDNQFANNYIRLSTATLEIASLRNGVSVLHANVANYHDLAGRKVKFKPITNGIDLPTWTLPATLDYYKQQGIIDQAYLPSPNLLDNLSNVNSNNIKDLKSQGRYLLNQTLQHRTDQYGNHPDIPIDALVVTFKRRFVDYKRPLLPFTDPARLGQILQGHNAHYIISGRVHSGDTTMYNQLEQLLTLVDQNPALKQRVHYVVDYDEEIAYALSVGSNISVNLPIVGLEACGTSWMKDVANLNLLVSTHDGGVADASPNDYLSVSGRTETEETLNFYDRLEEAARAWNNDFDLEFWIRKQLAAFTPVISGTRMFQNYLDYLT